MAQPTLENRGNELVGNRRAVGTSQRVGKGGEKMGQPSNPLEGV